ncbi:unnamed protein product [Absidia cylindrospora]
MGQVAPSKLHQENNTIDSPSASSSPDLAFDSLNLEDSQYSDSEIQYSKLNHIPMEKMSKKAFWAYDLYQIMRTLKFYQHNWD